MAPMNNGGFDAEDEVRLARPYKPWENGIIHDIKVRTRINLQYVAWNKNNAFDAIGWMSENFI